MEEGGDMGVVSRVLRKHVPGRREHEHWGGAV